MMDIYMSTKEIQKIVLAKVTCETVIEGLNGYFASDPRNVYITVRAIFDNQDFILYEPEGWADILISWLRTNYNIFYYPGMNMEAEYAKTETVCPLTEHIMNKGALNSLKKLYKNITGEESETNSYALIASTISCNFSNKDKMISVLKEQNELLKERITELEAKFKAVCDEDDIFGTRALKAEEEIRRLNAELAAKWTKTSLISWLQQRARYKNVELDDSFLYSDDTWYDWTDIIDFLFDEIVKMREEIENATYCLETDTVHDGAELTEQVVETVCKDIMTYICQESSRYGFELPEEIDDTPLTVESIFHDLLEALKKAKIEKEKFLIEVANRDEEIESLQKKGYDLYLKHRRYIMNNIRQEASRNGFDLPEKVDGAPLSIERAFRDLLELLKKRTAEIREVNDKLLETEDLLHKSVDSVNAECKAVGKQMVEEYEKDLLKFICKEYKNRIRLNDRFIPYDPPSVRNTITKIIRDYARSRTRIDILETRIKSIFDRHKAKFIVDGYVLNGDPTTSFMLDCISNWFRNGESRDKIEKYQLSLKDYILQGIGKRGYPCDGLQTKSIGEIVDWLIPMATCDRSNIALRDIYTIVASPAERLRYNDCDGPTFDHMKDYILIRFKGLRSDTEWCLKKIAELDGCQKELKTLEEQQEWLEKQILGYEKMVTTKDDEISRLKGLINTMNAEMKDM